MLIGRQLDAFWGQGTVMIDALVHSKVIEQSRNRKGDRVGFNPTLLPEVLMRTTQQLSITLPNEMADLVRAKVATGEYATQRPKAKSYGKDCEPCLHETALWRLATGARDSGL